jgi:hypothetical protein
MMRRILISILLILVLIIVVHAEHNHEQLMQKIQDAQISAEQEIGRSRWMIKETLRKS